ELQARLAVLGAMRAAEEGILEGFEGPAGALCAGAGREADVARPFGRFGRGGHRSTLPDSSSSLGRSVPPRGLVASRRVVNRRAAPRNDKKAGWVPASLRGPEGNRLPNGVAPTDARLMLPDVAKRGARCRERRAVDAGRDVDAPEIESAIIDINQPMLIDGERNTRHQSRGKRH